VILLAAIVVAGAVVWAALQIAAALKGNRGDAESAERVAMLLTLFAPALMAAQQDPRALLVWQPLARAARQLFPADFMALDRSTGGTFPFSNERIEAAHAQWTADWLAWELAHDAEYKLKAAAAEHDVTAQGGSSIARARLDAVEREKLDLYQRRYTEYVRTAKALQALLAP
jgi:hypothetical protein